MLQPNIQMTDNRIQLLQSFRSLFDISVTACSNPNFLMNPNPTEIRVATNLEKPGILGNSQGILYNLRG